MRLGTRLVLVIAVAALGPLGVLALGATGIASELLGERISDLQGRTADGLALYVDTWLGLQVRLVGQQTAAFRLGDLDERGLQAFLQLSASQVPEAAAARVLDAAGRDLVPPLIRGGDGAVHLDALRRALVPVSSAEPVIGAPYVADGVPTVPLTLRASDGSGRMLEIALGLGPVIEELYRQGDQRRDVVLLDAEATPLLPGQAGLVSAAIFRPFLGGVRAADIRYATPDGQEVLAACAPVPGTGWVVVIAEPLASATEAAAGEIRARTGFVAGVAALLSLVMGVLFTRQIAGPVVALKGAALRVAEGEYGQSIALPTDQELRDLTRAFNFMSGRLQASHVELDHKNREIEAWNQELVARVEARTRELTETQARLVQSSRLAAVGELGAGLAHELNNPLAGILGLTQVMLARAGGSDRDMLRSIEQQAIRCKEIVHHLLRFTVPGQKSGALDRSRDAVVDLDEVLDEVLVLVRLPFRQRGVSLDLVRNGRLLVRGDRSELGQALAQLLASLRAAAAPGSVLHVEGASAQGQVEIRFLLQTEEVQVGRDDWMASGLGFWAAQQTFAAHGGQLIEPPRDALRGSATAPLTWRVQLPEA